MHPIMNIARLTRLARLARLVSVAMATLLVANTALADVAPPNMPPGSNPSPESQTKVQMASESISITVREIKNPQQSYVVGDVMVADVQGLFLMRNRGKAAESMQVRFPLAEPTGMGSGFFTYPEVQGLAASVDGQIAPTTVISVPNPQGAEEPPVRWAAFDVTFPLTREVVISVSYSISPTGYPPQAQFAYVLSTGAGWYGTIGQVDITLRLPYPANLENVILNNTTRGARFQSGTLRWQRTNLEPTASDDWYATLLATNVWEDILAARQAELAAPRDAQKWLSLSQAYVNAVPYKYVPSGGEHFQLLAVRAMQIAVSLSPNSAGMRTEYASLLWYLYHLQVVQNPQGRLANVIHYNLNMALKLDPNNAKAKQLQHEIDQELSQG